MEPGSPPPRTRAPRRQRRASACREASGSSVPRIQLDSSPRAAPPPARDPGVPHRTPPRPVAECRGGELAAVMSLAGQADEQIALADLTRIDHRPIEPPAHRAEHLGSRRPGRGRRPPATSIGCARCESVELLAGDIPVVERDLPPALEPWPCSCLPRPPPCSPSPARARLERCRAAVGLDHHLRVRVLRDPSRISSMIAAGSSRARVV